MEALLSLLIKAPAAILGAHKLVIAFGAFVVAAITFITDLINKPKKKLVDSSTNRTEDIEIDDAASVRSAVDSLYDVVGETASNAERETASNAETRK